MRTIYFWPDGCWVDSKRELEEHLTFHSDDYGFMNLPDTVDDATVDDIVREKIS